MSLDTDAVIRQLRSRAQAHWEYLSTGERETRTKYALIDPILRSLGWDTEDPTQVRMEYEADIGGDGTGRVDYALFNIPDSEPYVLIEAKGLQDENADNAKNLPGELTRVEEMRDELWESFSGEDGLAAFDNSRMKMELEDGGMFPGMRQEYLAQLEGYARAFDMQEGYGVVTNGDAWVIYDMSLPGGFDDKVTKSISLLRAQDSIHDCVSALNLLRRVSNRKNRVPSV